ncbi:nonstructural protein [Dipodfec virus UOA04_Rod_861]|nr:nonstructural protein [Dipodfec virus UOA04_Rod_861]
MKIYSIFDKIASVYNTPFFCPGHGVAMRNFNDLVMDPSTVVSRHPSDFELFCLGDFFEDTGNIEVNAQPLFLIRGSEFSGVQKDD